MPAPAPAWVLPGHVLGVGLVQAVGQAAVFILPVLAQKQFGANEWQSLLITAPPTILFVLSIFWSDFFARKGVLWYVAIYWLVACLPLALIAPARTYVWLLIPHLIACAGGAGWPVLSGSLLKALYPPDRRGRAYSIVWGATMIGSAGLGMWVGEVLTSNPESFRIILPVAAGLQLLGMGVLFWLIKATGRLRELSPARAADGTLALPAWSLRRALDPITHMKEVLRSDPIFARYEAAYMTYGIGWMIGYALLPLLVVQKLELNYEQIAHATHVPYLIALVLSLYPAAMLLDRIGAIRSTGLSFGLLAIYPAALALARNETELTIVSAFYGVAHAGASVGWMLGPVSLAPSPDKVPAYVAIHATLVGVRGAIFQFLGVGLFLVCKRWLGLSLAWSFGLPLGLAAAAYAWSAWQMASLAALQRRTRRPSEGAST